jgi:hypothetical protein
VLVTQSQKRPHKLALSFQQILFFSFTEKLDFLLKISKCKSVFYLGKSRQISDVTKFEFLKKNPARE